MRRRRSLLALSSLLSLAVACGPPASPNPSPERVLVTDSDGRVLRRSTSDEMSRVTFTAPVDKVWPALILGYSDLGIEPSIADQATGRYGNGNFIAPRRMASRPLGEFFNCGTGLTGALIDAGRLTANVVTTIQAAPDGTTIATTHATGTLRRNEGTSTDPIVCASTGGLEERLRRSIELRLAERR